MNVAVKEKIRIRLKGYDHAYWWIFRQKRSWKQRSVPAQECPARFRCPPIREIVTILRAVHKYKDSREQFETRTHKRLVDVILRPYRTRLLQALHKSGDPCRRRCRYGGRVITPRSLEITSSGSCMAVVHRVMSAKFQSTNNLRR